MKYILSILALLLLSVSAMAQYRPLLGYADSPYPVKTTPLGVRYNAQGFDLWRKKWVVTKTPNWLIEQGASHLLQTFDFEARAVNDDPANIPTIIDRAWTRMRNKWVMCGGVYATVANSTASSSVTVIVEDSPFWMPQYGIYANGTTNGSTVRVLIMGSSRLFSSPPTATLVRMEDLLDWEIGNTFMLRGNLWNGTIAGEFGSRSPCGQ